MRKIVTFHWPNRANEYMAYRHYYHDTGWIGNCCGSYSAESLDDFHESTFGTTIYIGPEDVVFPNTETERHSRIPDKINNGFIYIKESFSKGKNDTTRDYVYGHIYPREPEPDTYVCYLINESTFMSCQVPIPEELAHGKTPQYSFFIYVNYQLASRQYNFPSSRPEQWFEKFGTIVYHSPTPAQNTNYPDRDPTLHLVITERL